ncbi:MAG: hypothetical protein OCD01_09955 [Fibrobacterales bacterium]
MMENTLLTGNASIIALRKCKRGKHITITSTFCDEECTDEDITVSPSLPKQLYGAWYVMVIVVLLFSSSGFSQFQTLEETPFIGWSTPTGNDYNEKVVMEARPILNIPIIDQLSPTIYQDTTYHRASIVFDPHIRMLYKNSMPVTMPSYRAFVSYAPTRYVSSINSFITPVVEHGHYSNGQAGCTFGGSEDADSTCSTLYDNLETMNLSDQLNRRSGEFSTNFVRGRLKFMKVLGFHEGTGMVEDAFEVTLGYTRYINRLFGFTIAGFNTLDTEFYSMNRYLLELAGHHYLMMFNEMTQLRYGVSAQYLPSNHSEITPYNVSLFGSFTYPSGLGLFVKAEKGQDLYNVRMVDDIFRVLIGISLTFGASQPPYLEIAERY